MPRPTLSLCQPDLMGCFLGLRRIPPKALGAVASDEPAETYKQRRRRLLPGPQLAWLLRGLHHLRSWMEEGMVVATPLKFVIGRRQNRQSQLPAFEAEDLGTHNAHLIRANRAMARYLNPRLAEELTSGREVAPRVRSTVATILFVDIRGSCGLLELLGPLKMVQLLDEFFTLVVDCVDRYGGTVDKFMGDAVMATFGLPAAADDHADRAVDAARDMLRQIHMWNAARAAGKPGVCVGIGIDTGIVVTGTIGAPSRMDYTVIGGCVNTAARLQQASEMHGEPLLISARTRARLVHGHSLSAVHLISMGRSCRDVAAFALSS